MIESQQFKDIRTGEIVTQFSILDIKFMEKIEKRNIFLTKYGSICLCCGKTIHKGLNNDGECETCVKECD